jgi:hypothetical protein
MFSTGLHSELTTQRQVTPKRIKRENKASHPTPHYGVLQRLAASIQFDFDS